MSAVNYLRFLHLLEANRHLYSLLNISLILDHFRHFKILAHFFQ
jgi:hypothetical protein